MGRKDDTRMYSMEQGCPIHGDEYLKECSMCGVEFCQVCYPESTVCPDCADFEDVEDLEELEGEEELSEPDFEDVDDLDELLEDEEFEDEEPERE